MISYHGRSTKYHVRTYLVIKYKKGTNKSHPAQLSLHHHQQQSSTTQDRTLGDVEGFETQDTARRTTSRVINTLVSSGPLFCCDATAKLRSSTYRPPTLEPSLLPRLPSGRQCRCWKTQKQTTRNEIGRRCSRPPRALPPARGAASRSNPSSSFPSSASPCFHARYRASQPSLEDIASKITAAQTL